MREIQVQIPSDLGFSEEQIKTLKESFANHLVETLRHIDAAALARPKTVVKPEAVHPEVIVEVV
jgi:hypothetical protein